ncbi:uncharacterized protein [Leptinotarsa decemlineata]|uniref:uncharacterized protein n=1 Tax=Leptinotarsa decemlineata TaxID=7539 RepID=UPI003D30CA46
MNRIGKAIVFLSVLGNLSAQNGYNYPYPGRPFSEVPGTPGTPSTTGGYPSGTPGAQENPSTQGPNRYPSSGRPTGTQFPQGAQGTTNGYSRPGTQGITSSSVTPPGSQQGGYPGAPSGPLPGTQQQNGYPASGKPFQPSGQYPSSNGQGGYPGGAQNGYPKPSGTFAGPSVQPGSFPGAQQAGGFPSQGSQPGQGGFSGQGGQPSSFPEGGAFPGQGPSDGQYEGGDYSAIPGEPDKDYPILSYIPETSFKCDQQQYPGYYADVETRCQVFHVCSNNRTYDFLCPNGTIFHQEYLVCVWWNQFDCNLAPSLFGINANIYDYSIIGAQQAQGGYQPGQGFGGYPQGGFPTGPIAGPGTEQGPGAPGGGYPGERPQRPGVSSGVPQASGGYPSSNTPNGPGGDTGYPGGRPQGPQIPNQGYEPGYPGGRPQSPGTNGAQQSTAGGYPSGGAQGGYPSGRPTQGPGGYPGQTGFPTQQQRPGTEGQQAGYPGGRPEGPSFPPSGQGSEPQRPTGSQGQGGYPSGANGAQRPGYPSQSTTNGYPSGRPQGPAFPTAPQNGGYQRPGGQETQQGGYPQGAGFPSTVEPGAGGDTTQGPAGGSYPGGRPGTPFPGTQQPNREYLPPF